MLQEFGVWGFWVRVWGVRFLVPSLGCGGSGAENGNVAGIDATREPFPLQGLGAGLRSY